MAGDQVGGELKWQGTHLLEPGGQGTYFVRNRRDRGRSSTFINLKTSKTLLIIRIVVTFVSI